jgi:hypothetical protein
MKSKNIKNTNSKNYDNISSQYNLSKINLPLIDESGDFGTGDNTPNMKNIIIDKVTSYDKSDPII